MICSNCGNDTDGNFCSHCGSPLPGRKETPAAEPEYKYIEEIPRPGTEYRDGPLRAPRKASSSPNRKSRKKETVKKTDRKKEKQKPEERPSSHREVPRKERVKTVDRNAPSAAQTLGETAVRSASALLITCSRVMQIICCLMMAAITVTMARAFKNGGDGLGNLLYLVEEENYGLALYAGLAGLSVLTGAVWCLWILSRKAAGGQLRMKKYDVGRGFLPFLICIGLTLLAGPASLLIPSDPEALSGMAEGAAALAGTVNSHRSFLLSAGITGAILSLIRKILRV